jgi:hypothetical protein
MTGPANPCRDTEGMDKSSVMSFLMHAFIWSMERGLFKCGAQLFWGAVECCIWLFVLGFLLPLLWILGIIFT